MNSAGLADPTLVDLVNELKATTVIKLSPVDTTSILEGDARTIFQVGQQYYEIGSYEKAMKWYGKAASYNYPQAHIKLGEMYFHGHGVPIDFVEAHRWYAMQCNDPTSQYHLAILFSAVEHPMYICRARRWFQCSAEGGNVEAQYKAGLLFLGRINIPNNEQKALRYFSMAATASHANAAKQLKKLSKQLGTSSCASATTRQQVKMPKTHGLQDRAHAARWLNGHPTPAERANRPRIIIQPAKQAQESNLVDFTADERNEYLKLKRENVENETTIKYLKAENENLRRTSTRLLKVQEKNKPLQQRIRQMEELFYKLAANSNHYESGSNNRARME